MDTNYCNPKSCDKKDTCNHHIVRPILDAPKNPEDLSDICLPDYRLYIEGNSYHNFPSKQYYIELLRFYDYVCEGQKCDKRKAYDKNKSFQSSQITCKFGDAYTCKHPKHPDNAIIISALNTIKAENEAFKKAGIDEGTVTYICPNCGSEAVANRYKYGGRYHGLGSYCKGCGMSHS